MFGNFLGIDFTEESHLLIMQIQFHLCTTQKIETKWYFVGRK